MKKSVDTNQNKAIYISIDSTSACSVSKLLINSAQPAKCCHFTHEERQEIKRKHMQFVKLKHY